LLRERLASSATAQVPFNLDLECQFKRPIQIRIHQAIRFFTIHFAPPDLELPPVHFGGVSACDLVGTL
jgi:hypothetical protein